VARRRSGAERPLSAGARGSGTDRGPRGHDATTALLTDAAARAARYLETLDTRRVGPDPADVARAREALGGPLPPASADPAEVLARLDTFGSPATMGSAGGRFFGFVIGGSLPIAVASNWLGTAWDQNSSLHATTPIASILEEISLGWLIDALALDPEIAGGFVTGATMANFSGLAAARHHLLARAGWDVERRGLFGAPEIRVVLGEEAHSTLFAALSLVGFGSDRVVRVPVDDQGRIRADALPPLDDRTLVCIQAGNVNSGAFDPAEAIIARAREAGAWVHVDGAFGLWAAASPAYAHLARGFSRADSWATDAHKWLNVPYDSGLVFCRHAEALRGAMSVSAAYLPVGALREACHYTPELSRRARGIDIWAALATLGRAGLADLIDRTCRHARRFAEGLRAAGHEVLNDVALNQVLVSFGAPEVTRRVIEGIQADGTCWCGGTEWQGRTAMRISVSSWATTDADVEKSLAAMLRVAAGAAR
jgi:glutamate/tyrosine decarboxylase-like PLP-dependent enzyme